MSLIDDALKRAAEAGTRRDAEKAPARPWTPPPLPEKRRRGILPWMIVVILAMVGVALFFQLTRRQTEVFVPNVPATVPTPAVTALPAAAETALPAIEPTRVLTRRPPPAAAAAPGAVPPETAGAQEAVPAPVEAPRPPGSAGITLEGIVWSQDDPVAMINGRILRVGAVVEGYTLTKIEADAVELQGEKGTIRLRVGSAP